MKILSVLMFIFLPFYMFAQNMNNLNDSGKNFSLKSDESSLNMDLKYSNGMSNYSSTLQNRSEYRGVSGMDYIPLEKPINPSQYLLGVGDTLALHIWGKTNIDYTIMVEPDGTLFVPKLGHFTVYKKSITDFEKELSKTIINKYLDTSFRLTLVKPRTFSVLISGEIKSAGLYQATPVERFSELLYKCGGILKEGSKLYIELLRNEKKVIIPYFNFEVSGDVKANPMIEEGDIYFIPKIKNQVTLTGAFKLIDPVEIYENEKLTDLINRYGGLPPTASFFEPSYIYRIIDNRQNMEVIEVDLKKVMEGIESPLLHNGDKVIIPVMEDVQKLITVKGAFGTDAAPTSFKGDSVKTIPLTKNETVYDVIKSVGGASPLADMENTLLIRKNRKTNDIENIKINLYQILVEKDFTTNLRMEPGDILYIPNSEYLIHLAGEIKSTTSFPFNKNYTVYDYIYQAGGPTLRSAMNRITIVKKDGTEIDFDNNYILQPGDTIYIPEVYLKFWQDYLFISTSVTSLIFSIMAAFNWK